MGPSVNILFSNFKFSWIVPSSVNVLYPVGVNACIVTLITSIKKRVNWYKIQQIEHSSVMLTISTIEIAFVWKLCTVFF